ncbi:dynamin family protein [Microbacterium sp. CJ88]|uniref:dynamin family protein n=1 Tax=Microbacterium sp. CJ88 TaxID=3445672 RepID=UPI003F65904F
MSVRDEAAALVRTAQELYREDASAVELLDELDARLREPLRLALAGMVKAGKSTLLNALLGERLAPTDAGECTRVVTWYRYNATPTVTMHLHAGGRRRMPVRRDHGRLLMDLGDAVAEEVAWIEVGWPSSALRSVILIDTPGIASLSRDVSARSIDFVTPDAGPSSADAIVYLMRHLHASDLTFLEAFRDTAAGSSQTVNAVAVLSRADEIGSGRIDSMLSAGKVARRYELDGELGALALGVVPVAGLLAESARTLREDEFGAFQQLAALDRKVRERLTVSADRFVRVTETTALGQDERRALLERFGIFGIRLASALIIAGAHDSTQLSEQLVQRSGLNELQRFIRARFDSRADLLKARGVLDGLGEIVRDRALPGAEAILAGIERLSASAHGLRELALLSRARAGGLPLTATDAAEAERILGGEGTLAFARLGLPETASAVDQREAAEAAIARWRTLGQSPLTERAGAEVAREVVRSLEEVASELGTVPGGGDPPDVVPSGGPLQGVAEGAEEQGQEGDPPLGEQHLPQDRAVLSDRDQLG